PLATSPDAKGVALLDANGDVYPDVLLYQVTPPLMAFHYGSASGQFTSSPAVATLATHAHFDDLDGDGARELIAFQSTTKGGLRVVPGSAGTFAAYERVLAATPIELDVATTDLDADGRPDCVFARAGIPGQMQVALGAPGGAFTELAPGLSTSVFDFALADANGDGRADFVATADLGINLLWHAGAGDGTFAPPVASALIPNLEWLDVADYDGDGRVDACVANHSTVGIARGNGDGTFQPPLALPGSMLGLRNSPAVDLDADGFLDPRVSASHGAGSPAVQWWLSNGVGGYAAVQTLPGGQHDPRVPAGDFDGDGFVDLAIARSSTIYELRYGDGSGAFPTAQSVALPLGGRPLCAADLDLDGRDELVCSGTTSLSEGNDVQIVFGAPAAVAPSVLRYHGPVSDDADVLDADGDGRLELVTDQAVVLRNVLPDAAGVASFGGGTPGCQGVQALTASHAPNVGASDFRIACHGAPPQSFGIGLLGVAPDAGSDPLGIGLLLHVNLTAPLVAFHAKSSASGSMSRALPIPGDPLLAGATLHAQLAWPWKSSASCDPSLLGLSSTSGLSITIQP
ncbi:MAG: VCBS repeat-containing protein, partial [Planctomycetota bacterium]